MRATSILVFLFALVLVATEGKETNGIEVVAESGENNGNEVVVEDKHKTKDDVPKEVSLFTRILNVVFLLWKMLRTGSINDVAQDGCDKFIRRLGIKDKLSCDCSGKFLNGFDLIKGDLDCAAKTEACLPDGKKLVKGDSDCDEKNKDCATDAFEFCGKLDLEASLLGGLGQPLTGNVTTCLVVEAPDDLGTFDVCVTGYSQVDSSDFGFNRCEATMSNQTCVCTPCVENSFAFTFDCSGVNISPFPDFQINGPKIDACQLFDFSNSFQGLV